MSDYCIHGVGPDDRCDDCYEEAKTEHELNKREEAEADEEDEMNEKYERWEGE